MADIDFVNYQGVKVKQRKLKKVCGKLYDLLSDFAGKEVIFDNLRISLDESSGGIKFHVRHNGKTVFSGCYTTIGQVPRYTGANLLYLRRGNWERELINSV
ncbi:MAG: hypothetical protein ABIH49_02145 [archaeon]